MPFISSTLVLAALQVTLVAGAGSGVGAKESIHSVALVPFTFYLPNRNHVKDGLISLSIQL